jgi:hypothetical protein
VEEKSLQFLFWMEICAQKPILLFSTTCTSVYSSPLHQQIALCPFPSLTNGCSFVGFSACGRSERPQNDRSLKSHKWNLFLGPLFLLSFRLCFVSIFPPSFVSLQHRMSGYFFQFPSSEHKARSERRLPLHFREEYAQLLDTSHLYEELIETLWNVSSQAMRRAEMEGTLFRERPQPRDSEWHCYGTLPFEEVRNALSMEEELEWMLRDIRTQMGPIPRSSILNLCFRVFEDTEDHKVLSDPGMYVFYSVKRRY